MQLVVFAGAACLQCVADLTQDGDDEEQDGNEGWPRCGRGPYSNWAVCLSDTPILGCVTGWRSSESLECFLLKNQG